MQGEFHLIQRLKSLIPRPLQGTIPIGDDTAILPGSGRKQFLFTTDAIVEGVDFILRKGGAKPEEIGHKALAVNLSDIAAMGGKPLAFVVAWGIPRKYFGSFVERAAKGMVRLARRFHVSWVGGDISRSTQFFISIALLGECEKGRAILRKGARPGNSIFVTGKLGGSLRGKHLNFIPRIREAQFLGKRFQPTSMIDVSDGFIQDLGRLLESSKAGARVDLAKIPISQAAWQGARGNRSRALKSALSDGEDFELLFTLPVKQGRGLESAWSRQFPSVPLTRVGEIVRLRPGKIEWQEKGRPLRLWFQKKGFSHF